MFTSRAEYRILLRQDNADLRLTEKGYHIGLASENRYQQFIHKRNQTELLAQKVSNLRVNPDEVNKAIEVVGSMPIKEKTPLLNLIKRPQLTFKDLLLHCPSLQNELAGYAEEELEQVEINIKYETYVDREQKLADKIGALENFRIKPDFDYDRVRALSSEAREKLKKIKPETIGQASRISGVSPADISILTVYMGK
jgi:tRNA uridine 5-carboxymethylaminomethyl modification enzyme